MMHSNQPCWDNDIFRCGCNHNLPSNPSRAYNSHHPVPVPVPVPVRKETSIKKRDLSDSRK